MKIGIVGCGTAGLALAILLAEDNHDVTLLERVSSPGPVGAGLLLQPSGLSVLSRLGVLDPIISNGARIDHLLGVTPTGRRVLDLSYGHLGAGEHFGVGVQRGLLFRHLWDAALANAAVSVRTGIDVVGVDDVDHSPRAIDAQGRQHGPFDVLVIADGARSAVRARLGLADRMQTYPYGALWFIGDDAGEEFGGVLSQVYRGTHTMLGFLPSGRMDDASPRRTSMFWSLRLSDEPWVRAAGLGAFRRTVLGLQPRAAAFISQLEDPSQLVTATYHDVVMRTTVAGRVVFIGDAAHAMSPQLGQGANLALLDAVGLAEAISDGEHMGRRVEASLRCSERASLGRWRYYQFVSRWLTPVFQSSWPGVGVVRDLCMGTLCKVPPVRREMLLSLAGVKRGLLAADPVPLQARTQCVAGG